MKCMKRRAWDPVPYILTCTLEQGHEGMHLDPGNVEWDDERIVNLNRL
jgi:hypothetical protein